MKKKIFVIALVATFFMAGSFDTAAAVCSKSPDGYHYLTGKSVINTYGTPGQHNYVWGYDTDGSEIVQVCQTVMYWENWIAACGYCNATDPNNKIHTNYLWTYHKDCGK